MKPKCSTVASGEEEGRCSVEGSALEGRKLLKIFVQSG